MIHIEANGRICIDGFHVGWIKRDAPLDALNLLAERFRCDLPMRSGMLQVIENEREAD